MWAGGHCVCLSVCLCALALQPCCSCCIRYCPSCKEHREATKQMSIWRLPDILVVHLKRFSQHNIAVRGKLDKFVRFPTRCVCVCVGGCGCVWVGVCGCVWVCVDVCVGVPCMFLHVLPSPPALLRDLDMSPYILGDARKQLDTSGDPALFDLLGVVNHHGAANYGHYTAHVQPEHSSNGG